MQNEELLQTRTKLEAILDQYTKLYDFAPVGYFSLDRDGTIRKANRVGSSLLGADCSSLVDRRFGLFVCANHRPTFNAFLAKIFANQAKETCEVSLLREGREPLWLEIAANATEDRQECHVVVVDISSRKRAEEMLREARDYTDNLIGSMADMLVVVSPAGTIVTVNKATCDLLGYSQNELLGQSATLLFEEEEEEEEEEEDTLQYILARYPLPVNRTVLRHLVNEGSVSNVEKSLRTKGGVRIPVLLSGSIMRDNGGDIRGIVCLALDITERKRAEDALRTSEARYRKLFEEATEGIVLADAATGEILDCNQAISQLCGYDRLELIGKPQTVLHPMKEGNPTVSRTLVQHRDQKDGAVLAADLVTKAGQVRHVEIKANVMEIDGRKIIQGFFRNITAETRYHHERETTLKLLHLLNDPNNTHELIRSLTDFLQQWTGCDAIGIRLRDRDDFPYFETRGFSAEFVQVENQLCLRDADGRPVRDPCGNPVLECMCGNVLCRRFNPALPFFTPKGSFWTNCTSELLATSEADRQGRTRNRCNGEGYESVALIALRYGEETIGLLQLNSRAKDHFTVETITYLERAADQIAMVLAQRQSQATLRESEQEFRTLAEAMPQIVWATRPDGWNIYFNQQWVDYTGLTMEESYGHGWNIPFHPDDQQRAWDAWQRATQLNASYSLECRLRRADGAYHWWLIRGVPLHNASGKIFKWLGTCTDIDDIKQAEEALRQSERQFRGIIENVQDSYFRTDTTGRFVMVSPSAARAYGFGSAEELIGMDAAILYRFPEEWQAIMEEIHQKGSIEDRLGEGRKKDGSIFWISLNVQAYHDEQGRFLGTEGFARDVTERKQAESNYRVMAETLRLWNRGGDLHSLVRETIRVIKVLTDFDAVGLRLREGEDFPYYEQTGFSDTFVLEENFLCAKDVNGHVVRDATGQPIIECTCGCVLTGRTEPDNPCFTEGGSFWTNESSQLLTLSPEVDPRTNPRNRCIHAGYESVALIPLRSGNEIVGLLQLNSHRPGKFTPELVRFFEGIATAVGIALNRKQAEEDLQRSEMLLRAVTDSIPDPIFLKDRDSRLLFANPATLAVIGKSIEAVLGKNDAEFYSDPAVGDAIMHNDRQIMDTAQSETIEEIVPGPSGTCTFLSTKSPFCDEQGRVVGIVGVSRDITERKRAEDLLRQREAELAHLSRVHIVGEMAAALAHELNQPLYAISNYVGGIESRLRQIDSLPGSEEIITAITHVSSEVNRAAAIIARLREFVRGRDVRRSSVDILQSLHNASALMEPLARGKGVVLTILTSKGIPMVQADAIQIEQVIVNLVANAIDAVVELPEIERRVTVDAQLSAAGVVEVVVEDRGRGVPPGLRDTLFEAFVSTKKDGLGVGLTISRTIIHAHGGKIWMMHHEPHGTSAHFTVPLAQTEMESCRAD